MERWNVKWGGVGHHEYECHTTHLGSQITEMSCSTRGQTFFTTKRCTCVIYFSQMNNWGVEHTNEMGGWMVLHIYSDYRGCYFSPDFWRVWGESWDPKNDLLLLMSVERRAREDRWVGSVKILRIFVLLLSTAPLFVCRGLLRVPCSAHTNRNTKTSSGVTGPWGPLGRIS